MTESPSQALLDQAKLELEARHPQATRVATSRHTKLRDGQIVSDMQLANMGLISKREWLERHPPHKMGRAALNTLEVTTKLNPDPFPLSERLIMDDLFGQGS